MKKQTRVILNSASNIGDFLASIIITLLMTPIYLFALGKHDYGIWEIISIVIGYMGLLDLGMRSAVVRYCSYYLAQNDAARVRKVYSTALIYMTGIGIICLGLFALWAYFNPESLSETGNEKEKYASLLFWVGLSVLLSFIRNTSEGMIEGSQRYVVKNLINLCIKIGIAAYLWAYLDENSGILLLIKVAIIGTVIRIVAYNILLIIATPSISPSSPPRLHILKELFNFGGKSLINGIASTIHTSSGAFLIGILLSPAAVPLYSIPRALVSYIYSFIENASNVLTPYFVELDESNKHAEVVETYLFFSKILIWFLVVAAIFTFNFGPSFIHIWLPNQFAKESIETLIIILVTGIFIERLNPLALKLSSAKNRHGFFAKVRPFAAASTFTLSYILIKNFGVHGAATASLITALIFSPIFANHSLGLINVSFNKYFKLSILPNTGVVIALSIASELIASMIELNTFPNFLLAFILFSLTGLISGLIFTFNKREKKKILTSIKTIFKQKLTKRENH